MIERILPGAVASAEAFDDPPDAALYPGEAEMITRAVDKRRREFRTVRHCARLALRQLGLPPAPVLRGEHGEPQWPPGVVGSMTHCAGYRAAVVAGSGELRAVGIDAEPHAALPADVLDFVLRDEERVPLLALAGADPSRHWDRIVFCAKEAVYKAWFPLTGQWLDFEDVSVSVELDGAFRARLPGAGSQALDGRWKVDRGLIVAATSLRP